MRATGMALRQRRRHVTDAYTEQGLEAAGYPQARGTQTWNGMRAAVPGDRDTAL